MVAFAKVIHYVIALGVVTACDGLQISDNCRNFSQEIVNITDLNYAHDAVSSPLAMWNLLFSVALGSGGATSGQILAALRLSGERENTIIRANKDLNKKIQENGNTGVHYTSGSYMLWSDQFQVNTEFKAVINYGLEIENEILNFRNSTAAAVEANSLVAASNVKFGNVLQEYDFRKSKMILTSWTSFEGIWAMPFNVLSTTIEPFYSEKGEIVRQVYMMNQRNRFPFSNIRELSAFVLQLPYGSDDKYCMLILLPSPGTSVSEVYRKLVHSFTLKDVFYKLNNDTKDYGLDNIDIKIPRFEILTNKDPYRLLNTMGVHDMYDSNLANFSRTTRESIYISRIRQRANIEVTESGTSVSASLTALFTDVIDFDGPISGTMYHRPIKPDPVYSPAFIANRPFIYYLIEKETTSIIVGGVFSEFVVF